MRERERERERKKERERGVKIERGRQKSNRDEDLVKRYDKGKYAFQWERERGGRDGVGKESLGPNLEQPQGTSFIQTGMEIDMGEVDLVFGFCVYYTKNPEQRRAQQLVYNRIREQKIWRKGNLLFLDGW